MDTHRTLIAAAFLLIATAAGAAQAPKEKTITQKTDTKKETATITAINKTTRVITLKNSNGTVEDIVAGPEVQRFDALKVGDKLTFTYHESVVYHVRLFGQESKAPATGRNIVRKPGDKIQATVTDQQTATVTVTAIDKEAGRISVRDADGHGITAVVENKKELDGIKVLQKVDITYTQAVMVTVDSK